MVQRCARGAQGRQAGLTGILDDLAQPVHNRPSKHAAQEHVEQVVLQAGGGRETRRGKGWRPLPYKVQPRAQLLACMPTNGGVDKSAPTALALRSLYVCKCTTGG